LYINIQWLAVVLEDILDYVRNMRVLGGLEWLTLEEPFIGALHTNSYSLLNGHGYGRMAENYRMLSEKDALAWCECAGHIMGPTH
tara:strand:- start:245 stop:499 length:255 start_codon:yes stop_codon:yes gene_type:complete